MEPDQQDVIVTEDRLERRQVEIVGRVSVGDVSPRKVGAYRITRRPAGSGYRARTARDAPGDPLVPEEDVRPRDAEP